MKLATVVVDGHERLAAVEEDDTFAVLPARSPTLDDLVRGAAGIDAIHRDLVHAQRLPRSAARLIAPLQRFNRDILCTGWNYWDHFEESKGKREGQDPPERPKHPTFFTKGPGTVIGPTDDIAYDPAISSKWDYEAEVALVIGKTGRSIPEERAWEHVFGLCVANDVSQRDLQRRHGGQWLKGKSIDATMPLGPWITTVGEIDDPYDLTVRCVVNGTVLQDASTRQVAFRFERIIAELSWGMTLRAGDVILTGTPSGIGNARDPQVFLQAGDEIVSEVSGLGALRNRMAGLDLSGYQGRG
ncbi:fumarylacetoacetate hydrolase family protein [Kribbella sp. NPDC051620]|uniref:fumarylacetoacetate hydrolase family protein n=1 Tax=Kribbella sp. NPDC051620 TaxID=3364120 RepID=UPI0037A9531A